MDTKDTPPIRVMFDEETMRVVREINRAQARQAWIVMAVMVAITAVGLLALWLVFR